LLFHFEEVLEDVDEGRLPEISAQDAEGLDERPTVGVKLGRGDIYLGEKLPLEPRKGKRIPMRLNTVW